MLKSLWIILSTLAIAHIIGLIGFATWLKRTDRLNGERLSQVRAIFVEPLSEEAARVAAEAAEEERLKLIAIEEGRIGTAPMTAEQRVGIIREFEDRQRQSDQIRDQYTDNLSRDIAEELEQLRLEREAFEAVKKAFEDERARIRELEGSAQFGKAVKQYETLKPDVAMRMLDSLLDLQKRGEVISYLNAMKPTAMSRILAEFEERDPALAAGLLQSVKEYGLELMADP